MNILVVGEHFSENLGDGLLCEVVRRVLVEELGNEVEIFLLDLSGRDGFKVYKKQKDLNRDNNKSSVVKNSIYNLIPNPIKDYMVEIKRLRKIKRQIVSLAKTPMDMIVFSGGQLFMDYFIKAIYLVVKYFDTMNTKIIFNCCGVGKNNSALNTMLLRKVLKQDNISSITLRDNYEIFMKTYYKGEHTINKTLDSGIICNEYFEMNPRLEDVVGIGVMNPQVIRNNGIQISDQQYDELIINIIHRLEKDEVKWQLFTNGCPNDQIRAEKIVNTLGKDPKVLASRPINPEQLVKTITQYKSIISMRMHSHIVAYSFNIPSIGFIWDKKIGELAETLDRRAFFFELLEENVIEKIILQMNSEEFLINQEHRLCLQKRTKELITEVIKVIKTEHICM